MIKGWRGRKTIPVAISQDAYRADHDQLVTLVNSLTDAVLGTDGQGIITVYNAAAMSLLDTNRRLSGRHISDVITLQTVTNTPIDVFRELEKSPSIRKRDDLVIVSGDDDQLRLEVTFAPVQSGNRLSSDGYVLILRDITKVKSLEEERDEFISVVSHELRTPITIAEGSLSNALLLSQRGAGKKVDEALNEAHKQVLFLAKMVNDLSTLSRAERGVADDTELIDLMDLASQLHGEYAPQAEAKGLHFNINVSPDPGQVDTSRLYLQELLQNFLTNAIKYTPAGSVTLSIQRRGKTVEFAVSDTGIGIGKSDLAKVFDRFYRAEDYRTRETNGTGLGLYVAAKLARKMGCRITVESRLNHGSTFGFSLPLAEQAEQIRPKT